MDGYDYGSFPGASLCRAIAPAALAGQGINVSWAGPAIQQITHADRARVDLGQIAVAGAMNAAIRPVTFDLPTEKPVSVPSSEHERSP
ncbi:hypothetical protein [Amycolatopsis cihanbeyliensis]|uniref:Uncharacterized protein n=1 Tax=Amycolatopsis cihanbeyliensis TaxID=1128664 RepID=A0A542DPH0_AMYCI|nr:hypothetical protein [Amycolatopsis cihanbeyliensis]TQJ04990.1 hypothetical protein FB471_4806 [Amycolatopsis cihanbeyliensis]